MSATSPPARAYFGLLAAVLMTVCSLGGAGMGHDMAGESEVGAPKEPAPLNGPGTVVEKGGGPRGVVSGRGGEAGSGGGDAGSGRSRQSLRVLDSMVEYAVIAPREFQDELQPLLEWKTQKGVPAKAYYLDDIDAGTGGKDRTEKVRNHLRTLASVAPDLRWVLLAGDHDVIPARMIYTGADRYNGSYEREYASDYYFAGLDGSWDDDGDRTYGEDGETDWGADVFVGRLPIDTETQAAVCVERIIAYERDPPDGDWADGVLLGGGLMDAPNVEDDGGTQEDEGYNDYKDNAYKAINKVLPSIPDGLEVTTLFDYPFNASGHYTRETDTYTDDTFPDLMDRGWSVIDIAGQAYYSDDTIFGNALAEYVDPTGMAGPPYGFSSLFNHEEAGQMANGDRLPLMVLISCDVGNFTEKDDTNFEKVLYAPDGGAIGLISSTGHSYRGETPAGSYGNWWANERFMEILYGDGRTAITQPGKALYKMKEEYNDEIYKDGTGFGWSLPEAVKSNLVGYNLLGDPELRIWTGAPGEMEISVGPGPRYTGQVYVNLTVAEAGPGGGGAVEGALVTVSAPGAGPGGSDVYGRGETDGDGEVSLLVEVGSESDLKVWVTARGFFPEETLVSVEVEPPDLRPVGPVTWGPVVPNALANITVNFTVGNRGGLPAEDFDAVVLAGDLVLGRTGTFTELAPGAALPSGVTVKLPAGDWTLTLHVDGPTSTSPGGLVEESREDNNAATFGIHVNSPPAFVDLPELELDEDTSDKSLLDLRHYLNDTDNSTDEVSFAVEGAHPFVTPSISAGHLFGATASGDFFGTVNFTITASDGIGGGAHGVTIAVRGVNDPPLLPDMLVLTARENRPFSHWLNASDVEGDALTFGLNVTSMAVNASGESVPAIDPGSGTIYFDPDLLSVLASPFTVNVTVRDAGGATSWRVFMIAVEDVPEPPRFLTSETYTAVVGESFRAVVRCRDPDLISGSQTEGLSFSVDLAQINIRTLNETTAEISFTPGEGDVGKHVLTVTADDGDHRTNGTFVINVEEAPSELGLFSTPAGLSLLAALIVLIVVLAMLLVRRRGAAAGPPGDASGSWEGKDAPRGEGKDAPRGGKEKEGGRAGEGGRQNGRSLRRRRRRVLGGEKPPKGPRRPAGKGPGRPPASDD